MNRAIVRDDASRQKTLSTSASIQEAEQGTNSKAAPDETGDDHSAVPDGGDKQRDEEGGGLELSGGDENQTSTGNALLEAKESKRTAEPPPPNADDDVEVDDKQLKIDDDEEDAEEGDDIKQGKVQKVMAAGDEGNKVVDESEKEPDETSVLFQKSFGVVKLVAAKLNALEDASTTIGEEIGEHKDRIERRQKRFKRLVKRLNKDLESIRQGMALIQSGAATIEQLGTPAESATSGGAGTD